MKITSQKRIAAQILKCSGYRVHLNPEALAEIKESITKHDIRKLINNGTITKKPTNSTSKVRVRKNKHLKSKGRQTGAGSRKGKKTARTPKKESWMNKIRLQRKFLNELKDGQSIDSKSFRTLYLKAKSGFFRSKGHLKLYLNENNYFRK